MRKEGEVLVLFFHGVVGKGDKEHGEGAFGAGSRMAWEAVRAHEKERIRHQA